MKEKEVSCDRAEPELGNNCVFMKQVKDWRECQKSRTTCEKGEEESEIAKLTRENTVLKSAVSKLSEVLDQVVAEAQGKQGQCEDWRRSLAERIVEATS